VKLNDAVWGALLIALGRRDPRSRPALRHDPGPAVRSGDLSRPRRGRPRDLRRAADRQRSRGARTRRASREWVAFAPWYARAGTSSRFALTIGVNVFYILLVDTLGFIPTGIIYLAVLFAAFGVRPLWMRRSPSC
jgi:hypothetical protein